MSPGCRIWPTSCEQRPALGTRQAHPSLIAFAHGFAHKTILLAHHRQRKAGCTDATGCFRTSYLYRNNIGLHHSANRGWPDVSSGGLRLGRRRSPPRIRQARPATWSTSTRLQRPLPSVCRNATDGHEASARRVDYRSRPQVLLQFDDFCAANVIDVACIGGNDRLIGPDRPGRATQGGIQPMSNGKRDVPATRGRQTIGVPRAIRFEIDWCESVRVHVITRVDTVCDVLQQSSTIGPERRHHMERMSALS